MVLALCGSALVMLAAAGPARGCPSLGHVKSFHGQVRLAFNQTASAKDASSGGTETVTFDRKAVGLNVKLTDRARGRRGPLIGGTTRGGTVSVRDSYDNTGTDLHGQEKYNGPVNDIGSGAGVLFRRNNCSYNLEVSLQVKGVTFSGDAENPGTMISQAALTGKRGIPGSLKLKGEKKVHAFNQCSYLFEKGCYLFGGGWSSEFDEDSRCSKVYPPTNCDPPDSPLGAATIEWDLSPTFKK